MLRSCYVSEWRLWPDEPFRSTKGVYYWADVDAPALPYEHPFGSRNWETDLDVGPTGELRGVRQRWSNGFRAPLIRPPPTLLGGPDCYGAGGSPPPPADAVAGVDCRCWTVASLPCPHPIVPVRTPSQIVKFAADVDDIEDSRGSDSGTGTVDWAAPLRMEFLVCENADPGPPATLTVTKLWFGADGFGNVTYPGGSTQRLGYEAVVVHVGEADPHVQYLLRSELPLVLEEGGTEADLSATGPGFVVQPSMGSPLSVAPAYMVIPGLVLGHSWIATADGPGSGGTLAAPAALTTPDAVTFDLPVTADVLFEFSCHVTRAGNSTYSVDVDVDGSSPTAYQTRFLGSASGQGQGVVYRVVIPGMTAGTHTLTALVGDGVSPSDVWSDRLVRVSIA